MTRRKGSLRFWWIVSAFHNPLISCENCASRAREGYPLPPHAFELMPTNLEGIPEDPEQQDGGGGATTGVGA